MLGVAFFIFVVALAPRVDGATAYTGTSIVIVRTGDEIIAAADSKRTKVGDPTYSGNVCKISKVGNIFFAVGGFVREDFTGFDAAQLLTKALRNNGTVVETTNRAHGILEVTLGRTLQLMSERAPDGFKQLIARDHILTVAFFGIDPAPYIYSFVYKFFKVLHGLELGTEMSKGCSGDCKMIFYTGSKTIDKYLEQNPDYFAEASIGLVKKLVELEIKARPEIVGPPIDVVHLTKTGARWIERKPECRD